MEGVRFWEGSSSKMVALAAGYAYSLALSEDGTVSAWGGNSAEASLWGYNGPGRLGDGSFTDRPTPVKVKGIGGVGYLSLGETPTRVEALEGSALPSGYALFQNHPNPFNPVTVISYNLPQASHVTLTIYALTGQKVATLVSGHQEAGHYEVTWDDRRFASGISLYRLEAGEFVQTRRMVLLK